MRDCCIVKQPYAPVVHHHVRWQRQSSVVARHVLHKCSAQTLPWLLLLITDPVMKLCWPHVQLMGSDAWSLCTVLLLVVCRRNVRVGFGLWLRAFWNGWWRIRGLQLQGLLVGACLQGRILLLAISQMTPWQCGPSWLDKILTGLRLKIVR